MYIVSDIVLHVLDMRTQVTDIREFHVTALLKSSQLIINDT
jgi:hypothetical protein